MVKTTFNIEPKCLEVKKPDGKYEWFISRLECNKQSPSEAEMLRVRCGKNM